VTRAQASAKERERKILHLTIEEVRAIEVNVNMYKGVGKMCAYFTTCGQLQSTGFVSHRFMAVPRPTMEKDLKMEEKGLSDELDSLNKKVGSCSSRRSKHRVSRVRLQSKYLEKQFNDAQSQLRDIVSFKTFFNW
jgi:prefoldin subunit 1